MAEVKPNPALQNNALKMANQSSGRVALTFHEILTKVNNAKDKAKKLEILRQYDSPSLRQILKGAFDPKIDWDLPKGAPPFIANEAPVGTEHTYLDQEAKRLWHFVKGADANLNKMRLRTPNGTPAWYVMLTSVLDSARPTARLRYILLESLKLTDRCFS